MQRSFMFADHLHHKHEANFLIYRLLTRIAIRRRDFSSRIDEIYDFFYYSTNITV